MSDAADAPPETEGPWRRMLEARPIHNAAARVDEHEDRSVTIHVKTLRPWYMVPPLSWIVPLRPERNVAMDLTGTLVWRLCDGRRTVEEVVDAFAAEHALTFHEARVAVTGYVRDLIRRGVLAIAVANGFATEVTETTEGNNGRGGRG